MTIWKKFKALMAGIELNRKVPRHPAHLWYALLSFLCIPAALVMHGHVHYTLAVTLLVIPVACVAYIPYRYCNILSRMVLNALIFGLGCVWLSYRLQQETPVDKLLVETLALWSLTFLMAGKSKGYFYLLFIDILLLLYGALLPRLLSLYLTIAAFVVMLVILFRNRTGFLSGDMLLAPPRRSFRRTWHFCLIWLIFAGLWFHFIFGLIPLTDNKLSGLIPVSFTTERDSFAAPGLQEWLKSGKTPKNGPDGKEIRDDVSGDHTALSQSFKGNSKLIEVQNPPPNTPFVPGDGGGTMGKDLVFRVKSPLKLYHLARLYDYYDGTNWRVSAPMRRNRMMTTAPTTEKHQNIKLSYSVVKLFSRNLALPWQYTDFTPGDDFKSDLRYDLHFWGVELQSKPSRLPLKFTAQALLSGATISGGGTPELLPWQERMPRQNYLQLPPNRISFRVRELAATVTSGITSPYAKALALRDFLRKNYTYKLHALPTPRHRESVDYFLFYLGEGHCEYFASALAVLARCAGLPARVATGFSPGNYNTLTSLFEIYEYHAHAWTQIHIPEFGWLTFDATPPSEIVSETYPPGLGKMRDPFGDEWRIRPPELTDTALEYMQQLRLKEERKKQESGNVAQTLNEIAAAGDKLRENLNKEHAGEKKTQPLRVKPAEKGFDLSALREKAIRLFRETQSVLIDFALYIVSSWTRLLAATGMLLLSVLLLIGAAVLFKRFCKYLKFLLLCRRSRHARTPAAAVIAACRAALVLLELKKMPRSGNQELLEYASSLRPDIAEECTALFNLFYRAEYRSCPPTREEAQKAAEHLDALRKRFKNN